MPAIKKRIIALKDGTIEIASAQIEDAEELISYIHAADRETDFLLREPDEFKMDVVDERKYIQRKLESENDLFLKATYNGKIVGTLGFNVHAMRRYSHKGQFGIAVQKAYWGKGIGKALIDTMIDWCQKSGIEKISLEVDTMNERAIRLYRRMGFEQEGYLQKDKKMSDGSYRDSHIMAKLI